MLLLACLTLTLACATDPVVDTPLSGYADLPLPTDSVYGTPPDPIPTVPPDSQASAFVLVPTERVITWQVMRATNDRLWQEAVNDCARTGTSSEAYGDTGMWCAIVAVINNDPVAAGRVIAKLRALSPSAVPNTRRQEFIVRVLQMDLVRQWLTTADRGVIVPTLDAWASHSSGIRSEDSDEMTGEGCGAILWDILNTRTPNRPNVLAAITRYVTYAHGGQWIESSGYNSNTVTLLAMCNLAYTAATGQEIVPGTSDFLTAAGHVGAFELTPDFQQAIQWGDDENPRDLRLFSRATFLSSMPSASAQAAWQGLLSSHWPWNNRGLMANALFLARPGSAAQPVPSHGTHVADGMGMLYWRHAPALSWAMAAPRLPVDHSDFLATFDVQVYRNGWLLTRPVGYSYAWNELIQNGPVYAGLNHFTESGMTWADSGNGWAALAGVTRGRYFVTRYPNPPEFLHYGGRVVVLAEVGGHDVVIVRDSVSMDDPRTLPGFDLYVESASYPHQSRINAFDGKMWALWHMPQQPTIAGTTLSWTAPNGTPVTLRGFADQPIQIVTADEHLFLDGVMIRPAEQGWQARLHTDAPVLFQVFTSGGLTVSRTGDAITVGGQTWTITSTGVTGP